MTDENKDTSSLELLKSVQVWIATLAGLLTAVTSIDLLISKEPELGVLLVSGVGALVLCVMLWRVFRAKKRVSRHDPTKTDYRYSKRQRMLALSGLIVLPTMEVVALIVTIIPPKPPRDRLVVAVASFTPVGGVAEQADLFTYSLRRMLDNKKNKENIPLEPKPVDRIEGSFSQTEMQTALKLGKSKGAHIVLWGQVVKDSREQQTGFSVIPFIAFTESLRKIDINETEIGWFTDFDAGFFPLGNVNGAEAASKIADIVTFIEGLMYYKLENWKEAKRIFDTLSYPTRPVEFYKGLCLCELAHQASDDHSNLEDARSAFERALGAHPWKLNEEMNCAAFLNMTSVVAMLSSSLQLRPQLDQLREVANAYDTALQLCPKDDPQNLGLINNNLGNVLVDSALMSADETQRLQQAADAYNEAISTFRSQKDRLNLAIAQNNLGTAYTELGLRINGQLGNEYLKQALGAYDAALRVLTYRESKNNWATISVNRSQALTEMGRRAGGNGDGRIRDAVAAYREVLKIASQKKLDAANARGNLANALREQARRKPGADGDDILGEAVRLCLDAVADLPEGNLEWVVAQERLGDLFLDQAMRPNNAPIPLLQKAVDVYKLALGFRDTIDRNQDWANSQNRLGIALTELARVNNRDQARDLDYAIASFDKALSVYDEGNYPEQHNEVIDNQSKARALRGS